MTRPAKTFERGEVVEGRGMKGIAVDNCAGCPFYRWLVPSSVCIVSLTTRGTARHLTGAPPERAGTVPRWCPLRKQDHLVTLRVK